MTVDCFGLLKVAAVEKFNFYIKIQNDQFDSSLRKREQ